MKTWKTASRYLACGMRLWRNGKLSSRALREVFMYSGPCLAPMMIAARICYDSWSLIVFPSFFICSQMYPMVVIEAFFIELS